MFELKIIESGYIMADGGAMFGAVPKRAWMRKYVSDENNLCRLAMRCVLAISEDRRILIDLGMGDKHTDKLTYYQPQQLADIADILNSYGYNNDDITDVVLTHLHFDHCGYATRKDDSGNIIPSFSNANYWLSQKQWDNMENPNRLEADSLFLENIIPVYDARLLHLINDTSFELCEGFDLHLYDGHTVGQLVPYINTKDGIVAFPGDLIPTAAHVPLDWISAYDISAITSSQEKERFLEEAIEKDFTLIYCHDEVVVHSKVKRLNDNYKATETSPV